MTLYNHSLTKIKIEIDMSRLFLSSPQNSPQIDIEKKNLARKEATLTDSDHRRAATALRTPTMSV